VKSLYIVRHCKAEGQEPDASLTSEGLKQAEELANFLEVMEVDTIVSSPFSRARQSIEPLANKLQIDVNTDERLSERVLSTVQMPDWFDRLRDTYNDMDLSFEGGESNREAMNRGVAVLHDLIDCHAENIVIVTHGALMSLLLKFFDERFGFDEWRKLSNPDVYRVIVEEGQNKLERIWR
jgi:2,3-bisphosphoglycerate-dependent phosphoglycerate mutase